MPRTPQYLAAMMVMHFGDGALAASRATMQLKACELACADLSLWQEVVRLLTV